MDGYKIDDHFVLDDKYDRDNDDDDNNTNT